MKGRVEMRLKRVLGLVLALAMVMSVVPAFSITAGAAVDEGMKVLTDMSTYDLPATGDNWTPSNGWNMMRDGVPTKWNICLNNLWSTNGTKITTKDQNALQAWCEERQTKVDSFLSASFDADETNDYTKTLNADKIVIDFTYAADTMDGTNRRDNYQYWRFGDTDGNEFAAMAWDVKCGAAVGFSNDAFRGSKLYVGDCQWTSNDANRAEFDKLLGVNYRISAEQQEDGTWNVTYLYDSDKDGVYEELLTETGKTINGFKSIKMVVGGYSQRWSAMGLMNLKVSYHETPAEVNVKYVDVDGNEIKPAVPIEGLFKGKSYEYTVKDEDISIQNSQGETLYFDNEISTLKIDLLKESGNEIILKYVADKPTKVDPIEVKTRVGLLPILPETVTAIGEKGTTFTNMSVKWVDPSAPTEKKDYQVKGYLTNFETVEVIANVTVESIDNYLVASYGFEGNPNNAVEGKSDYNATLLGGCGYENGIVGKGVRFPSNAEHNKGTYGIQLGGDFLKDSMIQKLDGTKEMTLTMYIKPEGDQAYWARVFDFGNGGADDIYLASSVLDASGAKIEGLNLFPHNSASGGLNQWSQFVMTMKYDGTNTTVALYSNGKFVNEIVLNWDATTRYAGNTYLLGGSNWKDLGFKGWMDEVRIYGAALEASEVKELYAQMPMGHKETIKLMCDGKEIGSVVYPNVDPAVDAQLCYAGNVLELDKATDVYYKAADGTVYVRAAIETNEITLTETENPDLKVNYVKAIKLDITNAKSVTAEGVECFKDGNSYYVPLGAKVTIEPADGFAAFVKDGAIIDNTFTADGDAVITGVKAGVKVIGAQVRIAQGVAADGKINKAALESSGLRFVVEIDTRDTAAAYAEKPTYGVEIVPADNPNATPAVIPAEKFQNKDETIYTAALVNLSESNYNRTFTAKPYIMVGDKKYYGESLDRSIYEVSAGLMKTDANITGAVYDVLNAYLNQVGVRIDIDKNKTTDAATADDVYTGDVFFTVTEGVKNEAGYYTVTVVLGDGFATKPTLKTDWWKEYVRVNNNNSQVRNLIPYVDYNDEAKTLTFVFDPKGAYTAE